MAAAAQYTTGWPCQRRPRGAGHLLGDHADRNRDRGFHARPGPRAGRGRRLHRTPDAGARSVALAVTSPYCRSSRPRAWRARAARNAARDRAPLAERAPAALLQAPRKMPITRPRPQLLAGSRSAPRLGGDERARLRATLSRSGRKSPAANAGSSNSQPAKLRRTTRRSELERCRLSHRGLEARVPRPRSAARRLELRRVRDGGCGLVARSGPMQRAANGEGLRRERGGEVPRPPAAGASRAPLVAAPPSAKAISRSAICAMPYRLGVRARRRGPRYTRGFPVRPLQRHARWSRCLENPSARERLRESRPLLEVAAVLRCSPLRKASASPARCTAWR